MMPVSDAAGHTNTVNTPIDKLNTHRQRSYQVNPEKDKRARARGMKEVLRDRERERDVACF
jgi:hypothetical protein